MITQPDILGFVQMPLVIRNGIVNSAICKVDFITTPTSFVTFVNITQLVY